MFTIHVTGPSRALHHQPHLIPESRAQMTIVSPQRGWCGVSRETKNLPVGIIVGCQILGDIGAQQLLGSTRNTINEHDAGG
ncbi:hypothetical protein EBZ80_11365 [bacterium]|nr:hypothetical protein [bacterium]